MICENVSWIENCTFMICENVWGKLYIWEISNWKNVFGKFLNMFENSQNMFEKYQNLTGKIL